MHYHTRSLLDHRWQQRPVDAHGRHQILLDRGLPFTVVQGRKSAAGCARAAESVDYDVNAAETVENGVHHGLASLCRHQICGDVDDAVRSRVGNGARRGDDRHAGITQGLDDGRAYSFRAARDEAPKTREFKIEAHRMIASDATVMQRTPSHRS